MKNEKLTKRSNTTKLVNLGHVLKLHTLGVRPNTNTLNWLMYLSDFAYYYFLVLEKNCIPMTNSILEDFQSIARTRVRHSGVDKMLNNPSQYSNSLIQRKLNCIYSISIQKAALRIHVYTLLGYAQHIKNEPSTNDL